MSEPKTKQDAGTDGASRSAGGLGLSSVALTIWREGDAVRVWNGQEYDGQTGRISDLPPPKKPDWLYTVELDSRGEHDCLFAGWEEMEPLDSERLRDFASAGIHSFPWQRRWNPLTPRR